MELSIIFLQRPYQGNHFMKNVLINLTVLLLYTRLSFADPPRMHPRAGLPIRTLSTLMVDYHNLEDTWINSVDSLSELNYGTHNGAIAGKAPYGAGYLVRMLDLPELLGPGKLILSCNLFVFLSNGDGMSGDKTVGVLRVFKPWVAGVLDGQNPGNGEGSTFNDWSADSMEWAVPGCHAQSDTGFDNEGDGTGADCMQTPESTVLVPQTSSYPWVSPGYWVWSISPDLANGWYNGNCANNGVVMKTIAPWGWVHPRTEEISSLNQRPYFVIEYVEAATGP